MEREGKLLQDLNIIAPPADVTFAQANIVDGNSIGVADQEPKDVPVGSAFEYPKAEEKQPDVDIDTAVSKFKRFNLMTSLLRNQLIGNYRDGRYCIPENLARDLIRLKKTSTSEKTGQVLCSGTYKTFLLNFELKLEAYSTYSTAKLYLVEEMDNLELPDGQKTLVGYEVYPATPAFLDIIKEKWNIDQHTTGDEYSLDVLDAIILGVAKDYKFNKDLLEVLAHIYILNMIELVGKYGYSKDVVNKFNEAIARIGVKDPIIFQDYVKQKFILDAILEDSKILPRLQKDNPAEFVDIYKTFYEPLERINPNFAKENDVVVGTATKENSKAAETKQTTTAQPTKTTTLAATNKTSEKKPAKTENKKAPPKKSAGKSAGGGGGKSSGGKSAGGGGSNSVRGGKSGSGSVFPINKKNVVKGEQENNASVKGGNQGEQRRQKRSESNSGIEPFKFAENEDSRLSKKKDMIKGSSPSTEKLLTDKAEQLQMAYKKPYEATAQKEGVLYDSNFGNIGQDVGEARKIVEETKNNEISVNYEM